MYKFVTHTWNAIKGRCSHDCSYCYMTRWWGLIGSIRLDRDEFETNFGEGKTIFVGSGTDIFADNIPKEWINQTMEHCQKYQKNKYIFQTKNPTRFLEFDFPNNFILGTTIETNRWDEDVTGKTSMPSDRALAMAMIKNKKFVTIEPIINFDSDDFYRLLKHIEPDWVNIGADSCGHKLPEPSPEKIQELIKRLEGANIKVHLKTTLKRLLKAK